jgi:hypothetical protein
MRPLYFIGIMLLCTPAIAGLQMEAGNQTGLKDAQIAGLVSNLVAAISANNQEAVLPVLHPDCRKQGQDEDVALFLKFVLKHKIPATYKWRAINVKDGSALLTINRFVVRPTICVDIFWSAPTNKKPDHQECLSILCVRQGETLFAVSYMNDYIKKGLQPSNPTSEGIRQPADGSPKPSM